MLQNDYGLLHQAYDAHRTQHNIFKSLELDGRITIQNDLLLANVQLDNKLATVAGDLISIALLIAEIQNYSGQIPPDKWYQRINQILTLLLITAAAFNDALRADILKSKMAGKYTNIPAQHAVGTQQVATQRLAQEKFLPFDNPESYEARIRPLLLEVADADANILGLLKGHLLGELYTWMKIANPASINAYFTEIKNMWLEPITSKEIIKSKIEPYSDISAKKRAEIENIVNSQLDLKTQQLQVQSQQPPLQHSSSQLRPQPAGTSEKIYEENVNNLLLWLYGKTPGFVPVQAPSLPPKPQIKKNITSNTNDVDEITKGIADMSLNIVKITKSINAVAKTVKKSQQYCSNCGRIGHNSRSCSRKKNKKKHKKKGKINNAHIDSDSDTSSNESDSNSNSASESSSEDSSSESESLNVNISRSKKK
ncbi:hypothetical protein C2G38_2235929 [Gigaspora rosea]|uniref:CCHC-type domain-containing protein n=1 Tax=Gigaspora rosea TaxID=44941 RepID=A0A397TYX2_9GLOM|nr:hypothetical protein C2G38_2235929 [Gigaspora rosea]